MRARERKPPRYSVRNSSPSTRATTPRCCVGATSPITKRSPRQTDHSINVYNWGEYIDESIFDDFEAETGIHVNYKTFASNEMLYSAIKGGGNSYDVIIPSDYMVARMGEEGLLMELDYSKIPNAENIDERYLHPAYDTEQK